MADRVSDILISLKPGRTAYADCPNCGYKDALAITRTAERVLYHCHAGCPQDELWRVVQNQEPPVATAGEIRRIGCGTARSYILALWDESLSAAGTVVERYLRHRGFTGPIPASLRYLPNHPHKPGGASWPVMLAAVSDCEGRFQAIHRTYLAVNGVGKASVQPAKMTLGAVGGFACHLGAAEAEIVVSEGIETGLSVQLATGIPTWAALSAGGVRNLILPPLPEARLVTIAADADEVGIRSAQIAATRWKGEGRQVRIIAPKRPGADFNDVFRATP